MKTFLSPKDPCKPKVYRGAGIAVSFGVVFECSGPSDSQRRIDPQFYTPDYASLPVSALDPNSRVQGCRGVPCNLVLIVAVCVCGGEGGNHFVELCRGVPCMTVGTVRPQSVVDFCREAPCTMVGMGADLRLKNVYSMLFTLHAKC